MLGANRHAVLAQAPDEAAVDLLVRLKREPREEVRGRRHGADHHEDTEDEESEGEPHGQERGGRADGGGADASIDDGLGVHI